MMDLIVVLLFALQQSENGVSVQEVCRKMGVSEATFYKWKKKFGGLVVPELRRLRQLEKENVKLKTDSSRFVFGQTNVTGCFKKALKSMQRINLAQDLISNYRISVKRACTVVLFSNSQWYYKHHWRDDKAIRLRIKEIATRRVRYGFERICQRENDRKYNTEEIGLSAIISMTTGSKGGTDVGEI